jgi:hypothetical protein
MTNPISTQPGTPFGGGIYAGVTRGDGKQPAGHLILLPDVSDKRLNWADAVKWAESLGDGARLPTRFESALLYANCREEIDTGGWYWTGTQCSADYAFIQYFDDGYQDSSGLQYEARVRAVRLIQRLILQSFDPSHSAAL